MRKLFILGVSSLFLGSPAMSATYSVDGFSTGNEGEAIATGLKQARAHFAKEQKKPT